MNYSKLLLLVIVVVLASCKLNNKKEVETPIKKELTLTKLWETDTLLKTCEAVRYNSKKGTIYVSNIGGVPPDAKDGDGSISILSKEGKILNQNWVTGINAPKGVSYYSQKLYVADIDAIHEIDLETGTIEKNYSVKEAVFLNDLDIDTNGDVYITDSRGDKIYKLVNSEVTIWLDLVGFNPNGILIEDKRILVVSSSKGDFISIDKKTKEQKILAIGNVSGDGIVPINEGYIVSAWPGEIYFVDKNSSNMEAVKILDTKDEKLNTADIGIIPEENILLVPTFFGNKVVAYKIGYK